MAGKSSRFPNNKPKWMMTHPRRNCFMVIESILGLNLDFFDKIIFVTLKEHETNFHFTDGLKKQLDENGILTKSKIIHLTKQTNSQSETVYEAIKKEKIKGFICIKDSDGKFITNIDTNNNQICYCDLSSLGKIDATSKSYIELEDNNLITNIIEKTIISSTFSVGGYCFESAESFCEAYDTLKYMDGECYISNVVYEMLLYGDKFYGLKCTGFEDYGTIDEWNNFKRKFKTIFIDLDGTLLESTAEYIPPYHGEGKPLQQNIDTINKLIDSGFVTVIITTSRPEKERTQTEKELDNKGIKYHYLIMDLPHCQRILINDFAPSNPFPASKSVNIHRNDDNLWEIL